MNSVWRQSTIAVLAFALGGGGTWLGFAASQSDTLGACGGGAEPMRRLELIFGLSRKVGQDVTEAAWTSFLDQEVTPRFPDGLTVLAGDGRWRSPTGVAVKERSRLLLIWVKPTSDLEGRIEAVREVWKRMYGQESVVRAESMSCVSF